jgi:hypothetical protein
MRQHQRLQLTEIGMARVNNWQEAEKQLSCRRDMQLEQSETNPTESNEGLAYSEELTRRKEYCKSESDEAYATINKNQEEYDKQLLTLATGFLAVLIAFLKDVVHMDSSICRPLLYLGFGGLGLTIFCVVGSFQLSIYVLEQVREYWQKQYNGECSHPFPDSKSKLVTYANWAGGVFFVLGLLFALIFIAINLAHQATAGGNNTHT